MRFSLIKGRPEQDDEFPLDEGKQNIVGRREPAVHRPDVDLWPDSRVSRPHAKVWYEDGSWWIEDVGSKHGTMVCGVEIHPGEQVQLHPDGEVKVGDTVLVLDPPDRHRKRWRDLILEIDAVPALNYSLIHCGLPVVSRAAVRNRGGKSSEAFRFNLAVQGYARSGNLSIPSLASGEQYVITNPPLELDVRAFETKTERGLTRLVVSVGSRSVMEFDVWVLAHNEWSQEETHQLTTASFVLPNHPIVKQVDLGARAHLRRLTDGEFDSFHALLNSARKDRVKLVMEALYEHLRTDWHLHYRHEPPSFESNSQKVRLPHQLLSDPANRRGDGTCIDLILLLAGCLEYSEAQPLMVFVEIEPGWHHAMVACWREEPMKREAVTTDRDKILKEAIVLECMGYAERQWDKGKPKTLNFDMACRKARKHLDEYRFLYAVDIGAARLEPYKIQPLPFAGEPQYCDLVLDVIKQVPELAGTFATKYIGTVHLLLALMKVKDGLTGQALKSSGIDLEWAMEKLELGLQGERGEVAGYPRATIHYDQVLASACGLAKRDGSPEVLEMHLLTALLETQSEATENALKVLGTKRKDLRETVRRIYVDTIGGPENHKIFSQFPSDLQDM